LEPADGEPSSAMSLPEPIFSCWQRLYFQNGGWVVIRFSGTEPLLRVFCEMPEQQDAALVCRLIREYFGI